MKIFLSSAALLLLFGCGSQLKNEAYVPPDSEDPQHLTPVKSDIGMTASETPDGQVLAGILLAPIIIPAYVIGATAVSAASLVLAPVVLPAEYAISQSKIVQPVNVVSANGNRLGRIYDEAEGTFVTTKDTVQCSGKAELLSVSENIVLKCNKGKTAVLKTGRLTTQTAQVLVGPVTFRNPTTGKNEDRLLECKGPFNKSEGGAQPFMLACASGGQAAIVPEISQGKEIPFKFLFNLSSG